jgi:hypothetical protein
VADHLQFSNDRVKCNITFIKSVHDWEVDSNIQLPQFISSCIY